MADNPLYPGNIPKDEAINPLYPGFYTGKAMQRKPTPQNFIQPIEFNPMSFAAYLEESDITVGPLRGASWLKDQIINDWKETMKAQVLPTGGVDQSEVADYETDSLPGSSGVGLSLSPDDWKDPKKYLKETALVLPVLARKPFAQ